MPVELTLLKVSRQVKLELSDPDLVRIAVGVGISASALAGAGIPCRRIVGERRLSDTKDHRQYSEQADQEIRFDVHVDGSQWKPVGANGCRDYHVWSTISKG